MEDQIYKTKLEHGKGDAKIVFVVSFLFLCVKKRNKKIKIWEKGKKVESA